MKKSLITALVLLSAVAANAGQIEWSVAFTTLVDPSDGTTLLTGTPAYIFAGDAAAMAAVEATVLDGTFDTSGTSGTTSYGGVSQTSFLQPSLGEDDVWIVAFDTASYTPGAGNYMISSPLSVEFKDETALPEPTYDLAAFGSGQVTSWQPVPEPGTIALAIAGLGAFIVKRRRNRK